jgi:hypothetical protein
MQGENSSSCKLFAFAEIQNLSEAATLSCFGIIKKTFWGSDWNEPSKHSQLHETGLGRLHFMAKL